MKKLSKALVFVLIFTLILSVFAACTDPESKEATISLDETAISLDVGESKQLNATVANSEEAVVWTSSDASKATVENGLVTALAAGSVTVTASVADKSASCTVTITEAAPVPTLTLDKTTASMDLYETLTLTAVKNNIDGEVTWSSSDTSKVTVNGGVVTSLAEGKATVTASAGGQSASCEITVTSSGQIPTLTLNRSSAVIKVGQTITVTPTLKYKNQTVEADYEFSTADASKVSVTDKGVIKGVAVTGGKSVAITVKASYNGFTTAKSLTVTVTDNVTFELNKSSVDLAVSAPTDEYKVSDTVTATVVDNGESVASPNIKWESGDTSVATVAGGVITAVGVGDTIVTATYTSKAGEEFTVNVGVSVILPVVELSGKIVVDLGADSETSVQVSLPSEVTVADVVKVQDVTDEFVAKEVDFTKASDKIVFEKADLYTGEKVYRFETASAAYITDIVIATKIMYTAEDIDNMQKYAVADKNTSVAVDLSGLSDSERQGFGGRLPDFGWKVYRYGGYFMLGGNIHYNKTLPQWCGRTAFGDADKSYPGYSFSPNNTSDIGFHGTFNGNGYAIYGMNIAGANEGFVGTLGVGGVIKNVSFIGVTAPANTAIVATLAAGTIENVYIQGSMSGGNAGWGPAGAVGGKGDASTVIRNVIVDVSVGLGDNNALFFGSGKSGMTIENCIAIGKKGGSDANLFVKDEQGVANIKYYPSLTEVAADKEKDYSGFDFEGSVWDVTGVLPVMTNYLEEAVTITNTEDTIYKGATLQFNCVDPNVTWSVNNETEGVTISDTGLLSVGANVPGNTVITVVATSNIHSGFTAEHSVTVEDITLIDRTDKVSADWLLESEDDYALTVEGITGDVSNIKVRGGSDLEFTQDSAKTGFIFKNADVKALGWGEKILEITEGGNIYYVRVAAITKVITTEEELLKLEDYVIPGESKTDGEETFYATVGGYFILGGNIDLKGAVLPGIGRYRGDNNGGWEHQFTGTIDGRGYTVSNFKIEEDNGGLVSYLTKDGVIKNIALIGIELGENQKTAALATQIDGQLSDVFLKGKLSASADAYKHAWGGPALGASKLGVGASVSNVFAIVDSFVYSTTYAGAVIGNVSATDYVAGAYSVNNVYSVNTIGPADGSYSWAQWLGAIGNSNAGRGVNNPTNANTQQATDTERLDALGIDTGGKVNNVKSFQHYDVFDRWIADGNSLAGFDSDIWDCSGGYPIFKSMKSILQADLAVDPDATRVAPGSLTPLSTVSGAYPVVWSIAEGDEVEGVEIKDGVLDVAGSVAGGTKINVTAASRYCDDITIKVEFTVENLEMVDLTAETIELDMGDGSASYTVTIESLTEGVNRAVSGATVLTTPTTDNTDVIFTAETLKTLGTGEKIVGIYTDTKVYNVKLLLISKVITTAEHFANMDSYVVGDDNGVTGYFVLGADVDMNGATVAGVGSYNNGWKRAFTGTFDGRGHVVSDFVINEGNGGLFSCVKEGSVIKDVSFINVINRSQSGIVATELNGAMKNVYVQGHILGGSAAWAPGSLMVSKLTKTGVIENCFSVVESFDKTLANGGAIVGKQNNAAEPGAISNSVAVVLCPGTLWAVGTADAIGTNGAEGNDSVLTFTSWADYIAWREGDAHIAEIDGWVWEGDNSVIDKALGATVVITTEPSTIELGSSLKLSAKTSAAVWSIKGDAPEGVTLDDSGLVSVSVTAAKNVAFTVVLTSTIDGSVTDEIELTTGSRVITPVGGDALASWTVDNGSDDKSFEMAEISGTFEKLLIGETEITATADGKIITISAEEAKKLTSGKNVPLTVVTSDTIYTDVYVSVKRVIYTAEEFAALESLCTVSGAEADGIFELGGNIDMKGAVLAGVGSSSNGADWKNQFVGTFDGKGYTISNFKIGENYGGLFSYVKEGAAVKNVALVNAEIVGNAAAGIVSTQNDGEISNVFVKGKITAGNGTINYPSSMVTSYVGATASMHDIFVILDSWANNAQDYGGAIVGKISTGDWIGGRYNLSNMYSVSVSSGDKYTWATAMSAIGNDGACRGVNDPGSTWLPNAWTDSHLLASYTGTGVAESVKEANVRSFFGYGQYDAWIAEGGAAEGFTSEYWTVVEGYPVFASCKDVMTLKVDQAAKTADVSSAEGLAELNKAVNTDGTDFSGYTVRINRNIDMKNAVWTQLNGYLMAGSVWEGNGKSIKNVTISEAADGTNTYDAAINTIGFIGATYKLTMKNLTFDGFTVGTAKYAAVIVGYMDGVASFSGVTVKNSTVTSTSSSGTAAFIGYAHGDGKPDGVNQVKGNYTFDRCVVDGVTVESGQSAANGRSAGFVGRLNAECLWNNTTDTSKASYFINACTVKNSKFIVPDEYVTGAANPAHWAANYPAASIGAAADEGNVFDEGNVYVFGGVNYTYSAGDYVLLAE